MPVLHIVNKSPYDRDSLATCLRFAKAQAAILLIEDGVYAVQKKSAAAESVQQVQADLSIFALQPDLEARGLGPDAIIDGVSLVDYDGFVELTTEYDQVQSWL